MTSSRLPRFERAPTSAPLLLTDRDHEILRRIHEHRFLRSTHICALISGSPQQILRRLQLLYHHGYLERPRAQLDYYNKGGSRPIVYGLGNRGAALLIRKTADIHQYSESENNRTAGRVFLEHELLVSDVMVAIELACREKGIRLITERGLAPPRELADKRRVFKWKVKLKGVGTLGVIPDRVFALEFPGDTGASSRIIFFLEADRGTMPVIRKTQSQTSFFRKLLAYQATWSESIHTKRFGFHRFRVVTVTTSAARVKSLIDACSRLERGRGLFLFVDRSILENPKDILKAKWQTGKADETATLLS